MRTWLFWLSAALLALLINSCCCLGGLDDNDDDDIGPQPLPHSEGGGGDM